MTGVEGLERQLRLISPVDEREQRSIAATLDRLTWPEDPFDVETNDHHVTASSFVVSSRGVILLEHRLLHIWVQPGGHVDAGEGPQDAVIRETLEETGLEARHVDPVELFHVDVHPGPHGHTHYDLRYVLVAAPDDPTPGEGESPDVFWYDLAAAKERCEPGLVPAIGKLGRALSRWNVQDSTRG
jgi:8-oxo-dGTP pyrophosphatase MutT (NUDIX family)